MGELPVAASHWMTIDISLKPTACGEKIIGTLTAPLFFGTIKFNVSAFGANLKSFCNVFIEIAFTVKSAVVLGFVITRLTGAEFVNTFVGGKLTSGAVIFGKTPIPVSLPLTIPEFSTSKSMKFSSIPSVCGVKLTSRLILPPAAIVKGVAGKFLIEKFRSGEFFNLIDKTFMSVDPRLVTV